MTERGMYFPASAVGELNDLLDWWRRNKARGERPPAEAPPPPEPPIAVMLLDDLPSGGKVEAAVLHLEETNEVQGVTIHGEVYGGGFQMSFDGSTWTDPIPWDATADEMRERLEGLPQINPGDVVVTLGEVTLFETVYKPGKWAVEFTGQYAGVDVPLMKVRWRPGGGVPELGNLKGFFGWMTVATEVLNWDRESTETVRSLIPVGDPTPMKGGAIALCNHHPGIGYVVWPVECRNYQVLGLGY